MSAFSPKVAGSRAERARATHADCGRDGGVSVQPPMPASARRAFEQALARLLARKHPGYAWTIGRSGNGIDPRDRRVA
jgi:hypothetical protein